MKIKKDWKYTMAKTLEFPLDLVCKEPILTINGRCVAIENYQKILEYHCSRILIQLNEGKVSLLGENLEILCYSPVELEINGKIKQICFESPVEKYE